MSKKQCFAYRQSIVNFRENFLCPQKIKDAHRWCLNFVEAALANRIDVVVSNTFTERWEMYNYIECAKVFGVDYEIKTMTDEWASIHNVPPEVIQKMRDRWEA